MSIQLWLCYETQFVCPLLMSCSPCGSEVPGSLPGPYPWVVIITSMHWYTGRSLGFNRCMLFHTMYDISISVYPLLPVDLESIVLLLSSILLPVIVTAELLFLLWHASDWTGKLPGELYIIIIIIIIVKTCFACVHFQFYVCLLINLL